MIFGRSGAIGSRRDSALFSHKLQSVFIAPYNGEHIHCKHGGEVLVHQPMGLRKQVRCIGTAILHGVNSE